MKVNVEGHDYFLENFGRCPDPNGVQFLKFVRMEEDGTYYDGTTNEDVLAVLIDRMKYLNGKFPCRENSIVITKLEESLMWLNHRTATRKAQGVEGKLEPHTS